MLCDLENGAGAVGAGGALLQLPNSTLQSVATDQGADSDSQTAEVLSATLTPTRWFHVIICLSVH